MTALRCTGKLLKKLRIANPGDPPQSVNRLGDWFANIVYSHLGHFVILLSERSLLPVVTTARDLDNLVPRFLVDLELVLKGLKVPQRFIDEELDRMEPMYFGSTNNRSILGSMNDFITMLRWELEKQEYRTLTQLSLTLAETPCGPLGMKSPKTVAPSMLAFGR
jgi:hypothetical protein